jgi:hypothetical protein
MKSKDLRGVRDELLLNKSVVSTLLYTSNQVTK